MRIFVYGTLKRGQCNNYLLQTSKLIGETTVKGTMYNWGAIPAITLKGNDEVRGEVYEITSETLNRLDVLEGYPLLYDRTQVKVDGVDTWVYHVEDLPLGYNTKVAEKRI